MKNFSNNILIIDDNVAYFKLLLESMRDNGDESFLDNIFFADSADKGYELYVTNRPMICYIDVRMPGKSGIDAAKMISDYDPSANIMLVTNYSNDPEVSRAISEHLVDNVIDKKVGAGVIAGMIAITLKTVAKLL